MSSIRIAFSLVILTAVTASAQRAPTRLERLLLPIPPASIRTATMKEYLQLGIETRLAMVRLGVGEGDVAATLANKWRGRRGQFVNMTPEAANLIFRVLDQVAAGTHHDVFTKAEYDTVIGGNVPTRLGNMYVALGAWMSEVGMAVSSDLDGYEEILQQSGRNIAGWLDRFGPAERVLAGKLRGIVADIGKGHSKVSIQTRLDGIAGY